MAEAEAEPESESEPEPEVQPTQVPTTEDPMAGACAENMFKIGDEFFKILQQRVWWEQAEENCTGSDMILAEPSDMEGMADYLNVLADNVTAYNVVWFNSMSGKGNKNYVWRSSNEPINVPSDGWMPNHSPEDSIGSDHHCNKWDCCLI